MTSMKPNESVRWPQVPLQSAAANWCRGCGRLGSEDLEVFHHGVDESEVLWRGEVIAAAQLGE